MDEHASNPSIPEHPSSVDKPFPRPEHPTWKSDVERKRLLSTRHVITAPKAGMSSRAVLTTQFQVRCSETEKQKWQGFAGSKGVPLSVYVRALLNGWSTRHSGDERA
jgi:hypothetical protein